MRISSIIKKKYVSIVSSKKVNIFCNAVMENLEELMQFKHLLGRQRQVLHFYPMHFRNQFNLQSQECFSTSCSCWLELNLMSMRSSSIRFHFWHCCLHMTSMIGKSTLIEFPAFSEDILRSSPFFRAAGAV